MLTPVVMVGYSRSETLSKSLACLSRCDGIAKRDVFLYLDAPYRKEDAEKCMQMKEVANEALQNYGMKLHVRCREHNFGVPGNLIAAVTEIVKQFGAIIFFEDDVLVSKTFLDYMDRALALYESDKRIFCINGFKSPYIRVPRSYMGDVYLTKRNAAWGFGIWQDRWNAVDFKMSDWLEKRKDCVFVEKVKESGIDVPSMLDAQMEGRVHTWDVQCTYHMIKNELYSIEPRYSLTKNIGFGSSGVHCCKDVPFFSRMKYYNFLPHLDSEIKFDQRLRSEIRRALVSENVFDRWMRRLRRALARVQSNNLEPSYII